MTQFEPGAVSSICSNLAKASAKQHRTEEAELFSTLAAYFSDAVSLPDGVTFNDLEGMIQEDLAKRYPSAVLEAEGAGDRGAQRALLWGKKVTSIQKSLLARFKKEQESLLTGRKLFVCEACGFISLGDNIPVICPICKAPASRFSQVL